MNFAARRRRSWQMTSETIPSVGVGKLTALAFVAAIGDPYCSTGAYLSDDRLEHRKTHTITLHATAGLI
jgi:hypothetical protein